MPYALAFCAEPRGMMACFSKRRRTPVATSRVIMFLVDIAYYSAQTAGSYDFVAWFEGVTESLYFLLFLVLWANHEKVHDGEQYHHHNDH